ncbi:MAG: hypothetical protein M0R21_03975 [Lentimicrobiaceae bacterium]|nr:hypothetical protein [Lentimicrobiaceae bacterium]
MKKFIFISIISALLISCGGEKKGNKANVISVGQDLECVDCWANTSSVVKTMAHSGEFACKLDSVAEYSTTFQKTIGGISSKIPKKINVSLWVNSTQPSPDASIVLDINNNGKSVLWLANSFKDVVKNEKEWTEFKSSFKLPPTLKPEDLVKIYVWNNKKLNLFIDDINIEFEY